MRGVMREVMREQPGSDSVMRGAPGLSSKVMRLFFPICAVMRGVMREVMREQIVKKKYGARNGPKPGSRIGRT